MTSTTRVVGLVAAALLVLVGCELPGSALGRACGPNDPCPSTYECVENLCATEHGFLDAGAAVATDAGG